ncbi:hypothetical protein JXA85_07375 [Candidatus Woesearchaeota archaeon]|nr:hypothetical protein [Candidatus Woesearchaeota archaeon]
MVTDRKCLQESKPGASDVESAVSRYSAKDVIVKHTTFYAINYENRRLIGDTDLKLIGEIDIDEKEIYFFQGDKPNDTATKAGYVGKLAYDGSLRDALEEFQKAGYGFNLFNVRWSSSYVKNGKRTDALTNFNPTEVTIDELFSSGKS